MSFRQQGDVPHPSPVPGGHHRHQWTARGRKTAGRSHPRSVPAAISVGIYQDKCVLDLDYPEDRDASVDANVVMTGSGGVEVQSSGEEATYSCQLDELLGLPKKELVNSSICKKIN